MRSAVRALACSLSFLSCLAADAGDAFTAFVSIPPQACIVERIGGDRVDVHVLVQPGQNPHNYDPTPRQMADLARARVFFRIGVPFEDVCVAKIAQTLKGLEIVDTRKGIQLRRMVACDDHDHHHDHDHDAEEGLDPHTWLNPRLVVTQAQTIRDALTRLDPAGKAVYEGNCKALCDDLTALDKELAATLAPLRDKKLFVFHPAFGYFADAYGMEQVPVEIEGKEPSARQLAQFIRHARTAGVRVIFVQPQFSQRSAKAIASAIDGAVIALDPLATDYFGNMRKIANAVRDAVK